MIAKGTFEVQMMPEPPYSAVEGVTLARVSVAKQFRGGLQGTSTVNMIAARAPVEGSAGYVAIEVVTASLDGRSGTFVLQHSGTMTRGVRSLSVTVVPDCATAGLCGLLGRMAIEIVDGRHSYTFEYELEEGTEAVDA